MWKLSFVLLVSLFWLASAVAKPKAETSDSDDGQNFMQEAECSRVGGICIPRQSCPPEKVSEEGQCPKQRSLGAVCCHSLSITETRCQQLGGQCRLTCPEILIIGRAADCLDDEKCCPLS